MKLEKLDHFRDSGYQSGAKYWAAETLFKAAKVQKCKRHLIPIDHLDLTRSLWQRTDTFYHQAEHVARCMDADLKYPILIGPHGNIMDGSHRLVKAIALGKKNIAAIRLDSLPEPDSEDEDPA